MTNPLQGRHHWRRPTVRAPKRVSFAVADALIADELKRCDELEDRLQLGHYPELEERVRLMRRDLFAMRDRLWNDLA